MEGPEIPTLGPGHAALLYSGAAEFADAAQEFVRDGRAGTAPAFVQARRENLAAMEAQLDGQASSLSVAKVAGNGANPVRMFGMVRQFAAEHRGQRVRCVQELGWASRPDSELREALATDALVDLALQRSPASVLCAYDKNLDQSVLAMVERLHPAVLSAGQWRLSSSYSTVTGTAARAAEPLVSPPADAAMLSYRENQSAVRAFTADRGQSAGLSSARVTDLVIAIAELTANTLDHAPGPGVLTIWATPEELICQVQDAGQISDPLAGTLRPDPASEQRGRGLWVVHQLGDLVEVRTGPAGTTTRLHMRRKN